MGRSLAETTTKQRVNDAGREKAKAFRKKIAQNKANVVKGPFTGWRICADCHTVQTTFWKKTGHAKAYKTLVDAGQQYNLNCLPCHVTGTPDSLSPDTGSQDILSLPPTLQQVGCEACHGPGKNHAANPSPGNIIITPPESTCRRCHTPARDDQFFYEDDVKKIACPPDDN